MKKRVISLLLCLVMAVSVLLTGCSTPTTDENFKKNIAAASAGNVTLSMWVVSETPVSEETANLVEAELNKISEKNWKVRLDIQYYTSDEYEQRLAQAIENFVPGVLADPNAVQSEYELQFPALLANQVDIIYLEGERMYSEYVSKGWLQSIDELISQVGNTGLMDTLNKQLDSVLLEAIKLDGTKFYAIPNDAPIGSYTYMLVDKTLYGEYFHLDAETVDARISADMDGGFFNPQLYTFVEYVAKGETDIAPIAGSYEDLLALLAHYWSFDGDTNKLIKDFSVFGHAYTDTDVKDRGEIELQYSNLFGNAQFVEDFLKLNEYDAKGFFTGNVNEDAAIKIVKCSRTELAEYEKDYYPVLLANPTVTEETIYDNGLFGICKNSQNAARAMEVISYLNSDRDFRNTLLYGVEGVHYDKQGTDRDAAVIRINNDYLMSMPKTGNVFIAYPLVSDNMSETNPWAVAKLQNADAVISPTLDFDVNDFQIDTELMKYLNSLNDDLVQVINETKAGDDWYDDLALVVAEIGELLNPESTKTVEDFVALRSYIEDDEKTVSDDLETLRANLQKAMKDSSYTNEDGMSVVSPYGAYNKWLSSCEFTVSTDNKDEAGTEGGTAGGENDTENGTTEGGEAEGENEAAK